MKRPRSLISACTLTFAAMVPLALPAGAAPKESTLDTQIAHGVSGCEGVSSGKTALGFIPPGFDYRFTATGAVDAHQVNENAPEICRLLGKELQKCGDSLPNSI